MQLSNQIYAVAYADICSAATEFQIIPHVYVKLVRLSEAADSCAVILNTVPSVRPQREQDRGRGRQLQPGHHVPHRRRNGNAPRGLSGVQPQQDGKLFLLPVGYLQCRIVFVSGIRDRSKVQPLKNCVSFCSCCCVPPIMSGKL